LPHMPVVVSATAVRPATIAITTSAMISPYSSAVAPRGSRKAREIVRMTMVVAESIGFMMFDFKRGEIKE
jgi:hypothetical protein